MGSHKLRLSSAAALLALAGVATLACPGLAESSLVQKIDEIVEAEVQYDLFSGVVVVAVEGDVVYARGVGEANRECHTPNGLSTRFNISSVQKCFIATVIMQLDSEGLLSIGDPLSRFYPACPYETADDITVGHLLNHSSGLSDYRDSDEYQVNSEAYRSIDDVLPLVFASHPAFAPGESTEYSNAGVLLLKGIIERVTGQNLSQAVGDRIFAPLGMDDTLFFVGGTVLENRAVGHARGRDGETLMRVTGEPSAYAGGGIYTSALDLLKFDQALYGNSLLDEEHKAMMFTPVGPDEAAAYGWFVVPYGGTTVVMHSGGSGGFGTEFRRYPEEGYTLIVQSNWAGAGFELTNAIEALLLGLPYEVATERLATYRRGMDLQGVGDFEGAAARLDLNTESDDPHMPSLYQAARSRILGEFEQRVAVDLLERYTILAGPDTQPSAAAARWRQGVALEQLGEVDEAIAHYRLSLELDPSFGQALEALERLAPTD